MDTKLGTLKNVNLREAWSHEAQDFTPWLADNLDRLSAAIGIPLELEGQEVSVDSFSADILARNPQNDSRVLIENQLEQTDHTHLGQILTYLAGLEAQVVIWVASSFRDPHISAVQWLNDDTVAPFAFFAVQVKAVQIGNQNIGTLASDKYGEALQFGNNNNGAWRILLKGGGGTPGDTKLMLQIRLSDEWKTKAVFNRS